MKNEYDVIIIGGGPGGLAAAEVLSRHRRDALLIEKKSVIGPKVCGGGISAKMAEIGIPLHDADRQFSNAKFHCQHKSYWITRPEPYAATIDRGRLGQLQLARLQNSFVEVVTHTLVTDITDNAITANGHTAKYRHLIGADGSLSLVRKHLGVPATKFGSTFQYRIPQLHRDLEFYFDAHRFGSGYGWIMPHHSYTFIGAGQLTSELKGRRLKDKVDQWCRDFNIDVSRGTPESWIINGDYRGWQFGNTCLVGDAGGFTPSFTGEGIYYAMISGQEAARKIIDPAYPCPGIRKILKKKRSQELIMDLLRVHPSFFNAGMQLILKNCRHDYFSKLFINFFLG